MLWEHKKPIDNTTTILLYVSQMTAFMDYIAHMGIPDDTVKKL